MRTVVLRTIDQRDPQRFVNESNGDGGIGPSAVNAAGSAFVPVTAAPGASIHIEHPSPASIELSGIVFILNIGKKGQKFFVQRFIFCCAACLHEVLDPQQAPVDGIDRIDQMGSAGCFIMFGGDITGHGIGFGDDPVCKAFGESKIPFLLTDLISGGAADHGVRQFAYVQPVVRILVQIVVILPDHLQHIIPITHAAADGAAQGETDKSAPMGQQGATVPDCFRVGHIGIGLSEAGVESPAECGRDFPCEFIRPRFHVILFR